MIQIKINSEYLDINKETKISFKFINPFFSENFINESYSYSFLIKNNIKNKRILSRKNKSIDVLFSNILFCQGEILSVYEEEDNLNVNFRSKAKVLKENFEAKMLNELELDSFTINEASEDPFDKVQNWKNHIDTVLAEDSKTGSHKFPMIKSWGYNNFEDTNSEETNTLFEFQGRVANRHGLGSFQPNFPVTNSFLDGKKNWITTVAPCPRTEYLLNKIFDLFKIRIRNNELKNIPEFLQMFIWNNYVLDKVEPDSFGNYYNTHSDEFDLKNHVPKNNLFSILNLLNEVFDAVFVFENNYVDILIFSNAIKNKELDLSKYATELYSNEVNNNTAFIINYPDELISNQKILESYTDINDFNSFNYLFTHKELYFGKNKLNPILKTLEAYPLQTITIGNETGYILTQASYEVYIALPTPEPTTLVGFGQNEYYAFSPYYLKSDEYENDAEIFENIYFGLYRGLSNGFKPYFDEDGIYDPIGNTYPLTSKTCNFKNPIWINEDFEEKDFDTNEILGLSSVFINGPDSSFDKYKSQKVQILLNSDIKKKIFYFPIHIVLELIKFKRIRHIFKLKNESFKGYIKTISFVLTNEGISASEIEYYVKKNESFGEFSDDYSDDFNN